MDSSEMTEERLAELERLCEATTPEPWYSDGLLFIGVDANGYGRGWFNLDGGPVPGAGEDGPYNYSEEEAEANTNFIAAARTALPELIAEVRRLRALTR